MALHLLGLPAELLLCIGYTILEHNHDDDKQATKTANKQHITLNALLQTCRTLYTIYAPLLYADDTIHNNRYALHWAAKTDGVDTVKRVLDCVRRRRAANVSSEFASQRLAGGASFNGDRLETGGGERCRKSYNNRVLDDIQLLRTDCLKALHVAAENGAVGVVESLLGGPETSPIGLLIDVNTPVTQCGQTCLMVACKSGHVEIVRRLLAMPGVDVNITDDIGRSALMWAASRGWNDVIKELLAFESNNHPAGCRGSEHEVGGGQGHQGVDVNLCSDRGGTALLAAIANRHEDAARLLLEYKSTGDLRTGGEVVTVDVNRTRLYDDSPLLSAVRNQLLAIVDILLQRDDIDIGFTNYQGYTALFWAAFHGNTEIVQKLLSWRRRVGDGVVRADVNGEDGAALSPLGAAVSNQHIDVVRLLLSVNQAKSEDEDDDGSEGHSRRVNVNSRAPSGWTPLVYAAAKGDHEIFRLLMGADGIDVNSADRYGCTALHYAAFRKDLLLLGMLLERKDLDLGARDSLNMTALERAKLCEHELVVSMLEERMRPDQ